MNRQFEVNHLIKLIRDYVANAECFCDKDTQCWRCGFEFNLRHLDASSDWNLVSEGLPTENGEYIVTKRYAIGDFSEAAEYYEGIFRQNAPYGDVDIINEEVVAWMPLPQPYCTG